MKSLEKSLKSSSGQLPSNLSIFVWPVDGEEQVVDTDHDLVPEWAGVAVTLGPQFHIAVDHELSKV